MSANDPFAAMNEMMNGVRQQMAMLEQMRQQYAQIQAKPQPVPAVSAPADMQQRVMALYGKTPRGREQVTKYNQALVAWMEKEGHNARMREQFEAANPQYRELRQNGEDAAWEYAQQIADRAAASGSNVPVVADDAIPAPPTPRRGRKPATVAGSNPVDTVITDNAEI